MVDRSPLFRRPLDPQGLFWGTIAAYVWAIGAQCRTWALRAARLRGLGGFHKLVPGTAYKRLISKGSGTPEEITI